MILRGVYFLNTASESAEDKRVSRNYILSGEAHLVMNILDASKLLDINVLMIVALNMVDIACSRKLEIDIAALQNRAGCLVVPSTASQNKVIDVLSQVCISELADDTRSSNFEVCHMTHY
ncbi:MAG: FeoB small GTPase domain-containing protein [Candidatus Malihini olakiniferum]